MCSSWCQSLIILQILFCKSLYLCKKKLDVRYVFFSQQSNCNVCKFVTSIYLNVFCKGRNISVFVMLNTYISLDQGAAYMSKLESHYWAIKLLSVMCRLHDDMPSLIRVWFLDLWKGCVVQYAVYAHRATGAISQGGYWHWISKCQGLGVGPWVIANLWHLW